MRGMKHKLRDFEIEIDTRQAVTVAAAVATTEAISSVANSKINGTIVQTKMELNQLNGKVKKKNGKKKKKKNEKAARTTTTTYS